MKNSAILNVKVQIQGETKRGITRLFDFLFSLLIIQYVVYPRMLMALKAMTLVLLMLVGLIQQNWTLRFNHKSLHLAVYIFFQIVFIINGIIRGFGEIAIRASTVYIIWPLTYLFFSSYQVSTARLKKFYQLLIGLSFFICVADTLTIAASFLHLSAVQSFLNFFYLGGHSSTSGLIVFRSEHIFFYAFFSPFMFSSMTMGNQVMKETGVKGRTIKFLAVYSMMLAVLSGMGAIWLSLFVGAMICVLRYGVLKRKKAIVISLAVCVILLVFAVVSYIRQGFVYYILEEVMMRLNRTDMTEDMLVRNNQIEAMIQTWLKHPFLGTGIGSSIRYFRGGKLVEQSQNEMTYFVMLYQRGLVGVILFFSVVIGSMCLLIRRKDARWLCEPFMVGMICFLFANAFNPYLSNMSTLWILFIPFVLGNSNQPRDLFERFLHILRAASAQHPNHEKLIITQGEFDR